MQIMLQLKKFIFILLFFIANSSIAQIDTITFRIEPDLASFKIKCIAQKIIGDTSDFQLSDTIGSAFTFNWNGTIEPTIDGVPIVTYEFEAAGDYVIDLSVYEDATGKTFPVSKTVNIQDIIRVPNVFSPNDDTINDLFIVQSNGVTPIEMSIYSRTGVMVYRSKAQTIVWDGRTSSGLRASEGVYFYILTTDNPDIYRTGFIHLFCPDCDKLD
ncbi:MAG: hypothetical protein A2041_03810 [Bacteroidetes bacterium GWA2_31_9b]|nr:MAG: hypothetical protein A2041_03810 [Bacteroidetes bacterium GWA2_31_9b]